MLLQAVSVTLNQQLIADYRGDWAFNLLIQVSSSKLVIC